MHKNWITRFKVLSKFNCTQRQRCSYETTLLRLATPCELVWQCYVARDWVDIIFLHQKWSGISSQLCKHNIVFQFYVCCSMNYLSNISLFLPIFFFLFFLSFFFWTNRIKKKTIFSLHLQVLLKCFSIFLMQSI